MNILLNERTDSTMEISNRSPIRELALQQIQLKFNELTQLSEFHPVKVVFTVGPKGKKVKTTVFAILQAGLESKLA